MTYFVTGATGFIGRYLVRTLLQRGKSTVYVLVRPKSVSKLDELHEFWGKDAKRVVAIKGDLAQGGLGVSKSDLTRLKGKVRHLFPPGRRLRHPGERRVDAEREHCRHAAHTRVSRMRSVRGACTS
jgi:thioester reductase-like protein